MINRITARDARSAIRRLSVAFPLARDADPDQLADIWLVVLSGVDVEDLTSATEALLREHLGHFPKPAIVRMACYASRKKRPGSAPTDLRSRYFAWENDHALFGGACPVCRATMRPTPADRRGVPGVIFDPDRGRIRDTFETEVPSPRLAVVHDVGRHQHEGIPWVGAPHIPSASQIDETQERPAGEFRRLADLVSAAIGEDES